MPSGLLLLFALATAPADHVPALPAVALAQMPEGVRERVGEALRRAEQNPPRAAATGELGMLLHAYGQYSAAAAAYARARALDPASFEWAYLSGLVESRLGRQAEAVASLREAVSRSPGFVAARVRLGEVLLAAGDAAGAAAVYEALLKDRPDLPQAHYGLGRAEAARGNTTAAIEHYEAACRLFQVYAAAEYALGLAYRDLGRPADAQRHLGVYDQHRMDAPPLDDPVLERVLALKDGPRERLAEGARLGQAGDLEGAAREHEKALALDPTLVQAHVNLISLYARLDRWEKAEEHYRAAVAAAPGRAEAHYDYGVLLSARGQRTEAAEAFRRALAVNPSYAEAHNNLATLLETEGKLDEAADHYRRAIANKAAYRLARFNLGRVLVAQGRLREAIEQFAQTLTPEDAETPRYLYALGAAYVRAGDRTQGVAYAQQALKQAQALGQADLAASIERDLRGLASQSPPR